MRLFKLLFPKRFREREQLYDMVNELGLERQRLKRLALDLGELTIDSPFIPSDLGFSRAETYDAEMGEITVFSKDGYHICRTPRNDKPEWKIMNNEKKLHMDLYISNLRDGIIILKGIGMDIDREDITDHATAIEEKHG